MRAGHCLAWLFLLSLVLSLKSYGGQAKWNERWTKTGQEQGQLESTFVSLWSHVGLSDSKAATSLLRVTCRRNGDLAVDVHSHLPGIWRRKRRRPRETGPAGEAAAQPRTHPHKLSQGLQWGLTYMYLPGVTMCTHPRWPSKYFPKISLVASPNQKYSVKRTLENSFV